jgi:ribose 5-phosphate isomerase
MKSKFFAVLDFLMSFLNRAEVRKCRLVIDDNNKLISQAEYVIDKQEEIVDRGRLIKSDNVTYFTIQKNVDYDNAVNVKDNVEILKVNLNAINGFNHELIRAHSKRLRTKQDIITDANNKILDANNNMLKATGGLSPKEYIYKYLPKELQ